MIQPQIGNLVLIDNCTSNYVVNQNEKCSICVVISSNSIYCNILQLNQLKIIGPIFHWELNLI